MYYALYPIHVFVYTYYINGCAGLDWEFGWMSGRLLNTHLFVYLSLSLSLSLTSPMTLALDRSFIYLSYIHTLHTTHPLFSAFAIQSRLHSSRRYDYDRRIFIDRFTLFALVRICSRPWTVRQRFSTASSRRPPTNTQCATDYWIVCAVR